MQKNIKLIAMDMDGTLLNPQQRISARNVEALKKARAKGIHIAICSGRLSGDSSLFALDAGLDDCHILALNGAYCMEKPNGKPYASYALSKEALESCLAVLDEYDVAYGCFGWNQMVSMGSRQVKPAYWGTHWNREGAPRFFSGREALNEAFPQGIAKVVYPEYEDTGRLEAIRQRLLQVSGISLTSSWYGNIEIMPQGVSKGGAVQALAARHGISADQVMALGDYDNDLSMIAWAGWGIAMANAVEAVKKAAKHVTLSNAEDGVAAAIEGFALGPV